MDGNKDESIRCIGIAEEAIASGNKQRALKFIRLAQRLNHNLSVDELLDACEKLDSEPSSCSVHGEGVAYGKNKRAEMDFVEGLHGKRDYTEERVQLIRQIKNSRDYYAILGVEKASSVEDIRKAYRKLSLKVHPDKNKAPGSEEAFKKICTAFTCLSDGDSRRQYDQIGLVNEFEHNPRKNVRRRRRRPERDFFDDDSDNEIYGAFFGREYMFRTAHAHRARTCSHRREESPRGGRSSFFLFLLQTIPFVLILLLAYMPFLEPDYILHKNHYYQFPKTTEKHGLEFYVKSSDFDENFPLGSPARANVEDNVFREYKFMLRRHCKIEVQRRHWSKNLPTPHCNKLNSLGEA